MGYAKTLLWEQQKTGAYMRNWKVNKKIIYQLKKEKLI